MIKDVCQTIKNGVKKQKGGFPSIILVVLGATLLANLLISKGTIKAAGGTIRAGKGTIRAGQHF